MGNLPRLQPPAADSYTDQMRKAAALTKKGRDGLMQQHYAVLMNNPYFLERWMKLAGTVVMRSTLESREKMMVVMHLAWCMRCSYAWIQRQAEKDPTVYIPTLHTKPQDHLSQDELRRLTLPVADGGWNEADAALLRATEESFRQGGISDATWETLAKFLRADQLYDLVMLVGFYLMTMSMINSLGVPNYSDDPSAPWARFDNGAPA